MAAIAGVLRFDGAFEASRDVHAVMGLMAHRAPDGVRVSGDGVVSFGHGALHTTPESVLERQPIRLGERWLLAVDGRIDNRTDLARALAVGAEELATMGDAELFALAWGRWNAEFWRHVEGDFALAAWDRAERRLTLLRDRIGARPLYFAHSPALLAFASEPEALLGLDGVSRVCDEAGLAYLLADGFEPESQERTLYRDVRRLRPGCRLECGATGQPQIARYWQPEFRSGSPLRDPREYVAQFIEVFDRAVRLRLRGTRPPALLLSGGIDSGSILAAARKLRAPDAALPLWPLSLVETHEAASEESLNIRRLHERADGLLVPLEELESQPSFAELVRCVWDDAHPIDNSLLYARLGCVLARADGRRVVLDGADGDTVMTSPSSRAGSLAASGHLLQAYREARLASRFNTYLRGVSPARILLRGLASELQPAWMARWRYRARHRRERGTNPYPWVEASFVRRLELQARRLARALQANERRFSLSWPEQLAWTWWNPGFVRAMEGTDRTYAKFGIEARHPWCDQRVVDFFLHLPEQLLARDGWTKWLTRVAFESELGADVVWHSGKAHLGSLLAPRVLAASKERVSALLASAPELLAGAASADALTRLGESWNRDPVAAMNREGEAILHFATLAAWMKRYGLRVA